MRKLYLLTLLFCSFAAFGQIRAVSKKVQELNARNQAYVSYNLFTKNNDVQKASKYLTSATDVTVLNLNSDELKRIAEEAPKFLTVSIPYQNEMVNVQLYKENILTDTFVAKDEQGNVIDYKPGEYYRGIVNGDNTSLVAISFFDHNVIGVISTYEKGNIVLGKSTDKQDYISYSDKNLLGENPFVCGVDELAENQQAMESISYDPAMSSKMTTENCVRIYYEIARRPYQLNGSDVNETLDWLTGIQNNIGTLYANDNINVALNAVKIWTIDDPYDGDYNENLAEFRDTLTEFDGDLAHLVNYPTTTSVAYLNSLCTESHYAYSGISMSYAQVPTYSWTIMAMTHEMGHSMGSPHTHHCSWNGNDTMIDGCGPTAGAPDQGTTCATGPLPSNGGTIMSYCHLVPSVGINFLNGFGPQPGALIRSTVDSKPCLGSDCTSSIPVCTYAIENVEINYLDTNSIQVQIEDNLSTQWNYQVIPFGSSSDSWQTIDTPNFSASGLGENQYYEVNVVNICEDGSEGGMVKSIILTGGFCDGTTFTDTGGISGSYGNNEHFIKTFYPNVDGEMVELSFDRIGLQTNKDFLYVHNGDSVNSPLFTGGTITGNNNPGPTFVSTHATGAITIEFISDDSGAAYGWEANVDCGMLGIEDMSNSAGITVYPNPASSVLNINSQKGQILSVQLTDAAGRTVLTNNVNKANGTLNISHLPKGVYILSIKMEDKTVTKKIIKK